MSRKSKVEFNMRAWDKLVTDVINNHAVPRMRRVADACNARLDRPGYMVSVEGDNPLNKRDYSATVITATGDAMYDNQKNNTLVKNFNKAAGR